MASIPHVSALEHRDDDLANRILPREIRCHRCGTRMLSIVAGHFAHQTPEASDGMQ